MGEVGQGRLSETIPASGEVFHELARIGNARIEHIVSSADPDPGEQVQDWDEWVVVIAGGAEVELPGGSRSLTTGDWLVIPAGTPHRVLRTQAGSQWIAVHGPAPG